MGQLQRGRGAGFLAALAAGREAWDDVLHCILNDPRKRGHDDRGPYYGDLIVELEMPVEPLIRLAALDPEEDLSVAVLAHAARRGYPPALRLLSDVDSEPEVSAGVLDTLFDQHPAWLEANADLLAMVLWYQHYFQNARGHAASHTTRRSALKLSAPLERSPLRDPFSVLAGYLRDSVIVFVIVPQDGPRQLSARRDKQVCYLHATMVEPTLLSQPVLDFQSTAKLLRAARELVQSIQLVRQLLKSG